MIAFQGLKHDVSMHPSFLYDLTNNFLLFYYSHDELTPR